MTASATERETREERARSAHPRLRIDFGTYEAFQSPDGGPEVPLIVRWFECFARGQRGQ